VTAFMDGWTYEKVRKKFKVKLIIDGILIRTGAILSGIYLT